MKKRVAFTLAEVLITLGIIGIIAAMTIPQLIQNYEIVVHPRCTEFYKEISNYCWAKDRDGKLTDKPDHEFSHGMDSMRYGVSKLLLPDTFSFD